MILLELRGSTAPYHERLENRLGLFDRVDSRRAYAEVLCRFYGFYASFEEKVNARPEWQSLAFPFADREKQHLLWEDLCNLGFSQEELRRIPICSASDLPELTTFAQILGCCYVLEGATLGGRIISRYFAGSLGLTAATGLSFYSGYREQTGRMWNAFGAFLTDYVRRAGSEEQGPLSKEIIRSACECFEAIERWVCERI